MTGAPAGYSGRPLIVKLGLKPGQTLLAIDPPPHYAGLVAPLPEGAAVSQDAACAPLVHLFVRDRPGLEAGGPAALARVSPGGALWVSWPKKTSARFVDLTEDGVRAVLLPTGWVDVKVCAVDQDWSGLKFMRRRT